MLLKFTINCVKHRPTAKSEGKVRRWCCDFKEVRSNVHGKQRSGRPSIQADNVERVNIKAKENRFSMISNLSLQFPEVFRVTLLRIVIETLNYQKLCAR